MNLNDVYNKIRNKFLNSIKKSELLALIHVSPRNRIFKNSLTLYYMHLNGTHLLNATPQEIWKILMDIDVLARITPGISRLEPLGNDKYKAIAEVKLGPVKGSFAGEMEIAGKQEPEQFTLLIQQNSPMGNVSAEGQIKLQPAGGQTEVHFQGDAKLSGTLARMGQRVLGGVANTMVKQFFQNLEKELNTSA